MKDAQRRRWNAEQELIKPLPEIEPTHIVVPSYEEKLGQTSGEGQSDCVDVQQNEFIAVSNSRWGLVMYSLNEVDGEERVSSDTNTELSNISDDTAILNVRRPTWQKIPRSSLRCNVKFITKDVVACAESEGRVSTWCARSGERLDSTTLRGAGLGWVLCKLTDTEFVATSLEGHLCFLSHKDGCDVKETKRIWKAHQDEIYYIAVCDDRCISASKDRTAGLWDVRNKTRSAVFHHNGAVYSAAISKQYIMTCSCTEQGYRPYEVRIFMNGEAYPLVKIFNARSICKPRFLSNTVIVYLAHCIEMECHIFGFFEFESEYLIAQLKVNCCEVWYYAFLDDGRVVTGGSDRYNGGGRCTAFIATLPEYLREIIRPNNMDRSSNIRRRRMCTIV